jgi:regulator of protease activity HflC (stomatin/prohibitin superfamily)
MLLQGIDLLMVGFWVLVFFGFIFLIIYLKTITVVPFNEIHVVSKRKKIYEYDGKGRYRFYGFFHSRTVIPKHVLDIEPGLMDLHDIDNLPFGVEISIKVQVTDPQKAAATLTQIDHNTVSKVVEDTVMSAARSVAMERTIIEIMKDREAVENRMLLAL